MIIRSVVKALSILDLFAERRCQLALVDIARALHLNPSTVHHIVSTLVDGGYLAKDESTGKYRLGLKALQLGLATEESLHLVDRARPVMIKLASRVNETVNLVVFDRREAVYVAQSPSSHTIRMFTQIGARVPLYCSGVGKVRLANMEPDDARRAFDSVTTTGFTSNTITEWAAMEQELDDIRTRGYAVDREERELGIACVAVPVRGFSGEVCAAISVSGPVGRILPSVDTLSWELVCCANAISTELGYQGRVNKR